MRLIDDDGKTYNEMTKADVDRMGGQMDGAMAQMQEQMKSMPPEQRARMEALMKGRGGGQAPVWRDRRPNTRRSGPTRSASGRATNTRA